MNRLRFCGAGPKFIAHAQRLIDVNNEVRATFRKLTVEKNSRVLIISMDHGNNCLTIYVKNIYCKQHENSKVIHLQPLKSEIAIKIQT